MLNLLVIAAALPLADSTSAAAVKTVTLEQALQIALSENASVKVADMEIEKTGYARKGTYAALYPKIDGTGTFQRTIKKQVMYMDGDSFDIGSMIGGALADYLLPLYGKHPDLPIPQPKKEDPEPSSNDGFSVGRWNTWSTGISAAMPLVNAQLWQTLKVSDLDVELAVEKARSSRIETVTQVKDAFFGVLLAKEAFNVYKSVYENALANLEQTQRKYNAQKASELDLLRAKTNLANSIPDVCNAESSIILALWQLKAVMGVNLDTEIDTIGNLDDYASQLASNSSANGAFDLTNNSSMRQLEIQAEELARAVRIQQYANIPTLSLAFSYSLNAMANDFKFSEYQWSPYSYVALSLNIPIFSGFKRSNDIKKARVQANELAIQREDAERQLRIAIRQYLNTMETQVNSYSSAQSAVEMARKAYGIASKSYEVGRSTLTDLNDAQLALTRAELGVCQTIYTFVVAKAGLEGIIGADFLSKDGKVQLK